jgi:hypothetical protein
MQAGTAFERMTGGTAVPLDSKPPTTADVATEVLPGFKVLARRNEDPTPASPLTYREMAIAVADTTSLKDAEAIARAQYEILRNAISGAPKGKFIQLAVFDHEFTGKPKKPPIVLLTFKDWRDREPDIRHPDRDGPSSRAPASVAPGAAATTRSVPPPAAPSAPPPAPASAAPTPVIGSPAVEDTVLRTIEPPPAARPSAPTNPTLALPTAPAEDVEPIRPARVISIGDEPPAAMPSAPAAAAAPAPAPSAPASQPPAVAAIAIPAPTPSALKREAKAMAGDDDLTLVNKDTAPIADVAPATIAEPPPAGVTAQPEPATERMPSAPPPAMTGGPVPSAPPPAPVPSAPPPAPAADAGPVSAPPPPRRPSVPSAAPAPPSRPPPASTLVFRQAKGPRRSGDDLIADLFEACSDLGFLADPLEGADFVLSLLLEMLHAKVALVSFYDINAREFVVVRQGIGGPEGSVEVPNAALTRSSEMTPHVLRTMRAGRAVLLTRGDDALAEDGRWRALGVSPTSVLSAPIRSGGRYLGLLELADADDGRPFTEGDGHAVTYIAEQFAEFLSQREVVTDSERVSRPRLSQLARR